MAWTTPRTWVTGEVVTAALLNAQIKGNSDLSAPAIMTTAGDIIYASGANTPARLAKDANSTRVLTNTGTSNIPAWAQVTLTSGVTGTLPVGNGGTGITSLGSNVATFLGTPSSANLRSALTDETGTGGAVFATSPTLTTPALGTPSALVATNATGTAANLTAGTVTANANLTGVVTSSGNATAIADKAIGIAKLADGTDGELITWNASGVIAAVAVGSDGQVLTSNGAGSPPTFQAAGGGGAVVREGGNTTEATSTSTSWVDLLSLTSLTIAAAEPFMVTVAARKTSGHGSGSGLAHKVNTTALSSSLGPSGDDPPWVASNNNSAQDGSPWSFCSPRVTNYLNGVNTVAHATPTASGLNTTTYMSDAGMHDSGVPNAEITTFIFTGINDNSANTVGADEGHIYSLAVS